MRTALIFSFITFLVVGINCQRKVAIARLTSATISGSVQFAETDNGVHVTGTIMGLPVGEYGFHVHELGDITTCDTTGAHFNPDKTDHGGPDHDVRHVGDFGNVAFVETGVSVVANIDFVDSVASLGGRNSVVGRALVLHEARDDLGQGGQESSLTTGNAGARVACAVIGIFSPGEPWNSAASAAPSLILMAAALVFFFIKFERDNGGDIHTTTI